MFNKFVYTYAAINTTQTFVHDSVMLQFMIMLVILHTVRGQTLLLMPPMKKFCLSLMAEKRFYLCVGLRKIYVFL